MNTIHQSTTGLCPKCQAVRNLGVNIERQTTQDQGETVTILETATAHCQACGTFVSRQSREVTEQAA